MAVTRSNDAGKNRRREAEHSGGEEPFRVTRTTPAELAYTQLTFPAHLEYRAGSMLGADDHTINT